VQKVDLNQLVMQCGPLCVEQDQQTMKDLFEYRIFTECYAASEAAKRATKEQIEKLRLSNQTMSELLGNQEEMEHISLDFHNLIVQIADNTILSLVTAFLTQILKQSRHKTLWDEKRHEESCHYHKLILSAIEAHDPEKASLYMRKHLEMARDRLIAHMQQE
jgi:DNA-binding FadR family transcriptional regulator